MVQPTLTITNNRGSITLFAIIVVSAIGFSVVASFALGAFSFIRQETNLNNLFQAKNLSNICAEEALELIRLSNGYIGSGSISENSGNCNYAVSNSGGENYTINTSGNYNNAVRKLNISVSQITPKIVISSWREVAD